MSLVFDLPPLANTNAPNRVHLPKFVYRLAHANSGNHCIYHTGIDRDYAHPATFVEDPQNAITAYAKVQPHNFDGDTFRRQLLQRVRNPPHSSFISFSDSAEKTRKRIALWYKKGARLINIIKITTEGMIPAILTGEDRGDLLVWVSQSAKPENGQPIALARFCSLDPTPEIFISMSQVYNDQPWGPWWHRTSYQEDEWFIGHAVPKARVLEVLPCTNTNIVLNNKTLVTEYLNNSQYWWERMATIWRRTRDYKRPHEEVSADEKPHQRSWFELEEKINNGGDARSQRMCYKKRGYNPQWEDPKHMTKRSKRTLAQREQDQDIPGEQDGGQSKKELVTENDEEKIRQAGEESEESTDIDASKGKSDDSKDVNNGEKSSKKTTAMA